MGRLLCLFVTVRLRDIKNSNILQLLGFFFFLSALEHPLKIFLENMWHVGPPVSLLASENKLPLAEHSSAQGS